MIDDKFTEKAMNLEEVIGSFGIPLDLKKLKDVLMYQFALRLDKPVESPPKFHQLYSSLDVARKKSSTIAQAYDTAEKAFAFTDKRFSGHEKFDGHVVPVARNAVRDSIYLPVEKQENYIIKALLHDIIEDTDWTIDDVKRTFGDDVAVHVDLMTKYNKNDNRIYAAAWKDMEAALLKYDDRLHNLSTIGHIPTKKKQDAFARETIKKLVPILEHHGLKRHSNDLYSLAMLHMIGAQIYGLDNIVLPEMRKAV